MANQLGIVHPGLISALSAFYPSRCTIGSATETQSPTGAVQQGWAAVPGLVDLPCRMAPAQAGQSSREVRSDSGTYGDYAYTIALQGYYPTITETHQVTVDGVTYDVQSVAHDNNHAATELFVRLVR